MVGTWALATHASMTARKTRTAGSYHVDEPLRLYRFRPVWSGTPTGVRNAPGYSERDDHSPPMFSVPARADLFRPSRRGAVLGRRPRLATRRSRQAPGDR